MEGMKGLLDFATSPMGQGLLAAGFGGLAGANRNTPINNIGRAGLAGLTGYSAASALQDQRLKREEAERVKAAIPTLYTQGPDGSMKFDTMAALKLGIGPTDVIAYGDAMNAGRAKVARTQEVEGPDGGKQVVQLDDYGQQVGSGLNGYVAPQLVDTGDMKQFVKPSAGQAFQVGMSPSERDASQRGWAGVGIRSEQNDIARDANAIMRDLNIQEKGLKIEELQGKREERNRSKEAQQASIAAQLGVIDKALQHPGREAATGLSGVLDPRNYVPGTTPRDFQVVLDQIGGTAFLQAFESLKGGGQITEVEGKKATDAMARLNRAQSDEEFQRSLMDLREVMQKAKARLGGGQAPQQQMQQQSQRAVVRTGRDASGRKVVQYSDGSLEYGD